MPLRAISIDDDPMAILVIQKWADKSTQVDLVKTYTDPIMGSAGIILDQPDILFLDIEMPEFNGIQILSALKRPPKVIVVSSNPDYKEKALGLNALAFIRKPISQEDFESTVEKARLIIESEHLV
jgi:two-component SAPR family response regulator